LSIKTPVLLLLKKKQTNIVQINGYLANLLAGEISPPKYGDLGSPVIMMIINEVEIPNALVD